MMQVFILFLIIIFSIKLMITASFYDVLLIVMCFIFLFYFKKVKKNALLYKKKWFKVLRKNRKIKMLKIKIEYWWYYIYFSIFFSKPFFHFCLVLPEMIYKYILYQSFSVSMMVYILPTKEGDEFVLALANNWTRSNSDIHQQILYYRSKQNLFLCLVMHGVNSAEAVSCTNKVILRSLEDGDIGIQVDEEGPGADWIFADGEPMQIKNIFALNFDTFKKDVERYPEDLNIDYLFRGFKSEYDRERIENMVELINKENKRKIELRYFFEEKNQVTKIKLKKFNELLFEKYPNYCKLRDATALFWKDICTAIVKSFKKVI